MQRRTHNQHIRSGQVKILSGAIQRGDLSRTELIQRSAERNNAHNTDLNAVVITDFDRAEHVAKQRDDNQRGTMLERRLPLDGLPLLVKDCDDVEGLPTRHGSYTSDPRS